MEHLLIYGLMVFGLVAATVYLVLARMDRKTEAQEQGVVFTSSWAGYYEQESGRSGSSAGTRVPGESVQSFFMRLKKKAAKSVEHLLTDRVAVETEVLYFVLQFLMYMESGMTFMSALQKTQTAMEEADYSIAGELRKINFKLRGGVPFGEAIKVLDGNSRYAILKEFFLVISQAQEIGVPVSDALKGAIKEFEEVRVIKAEERASKLSVMMAIPIVFGFLPSIIVLVLAPAVHGLFEALG